MFFVTLVFVGLYFFGNFRINDTNVRDFLQKNITVSRLNIVKDGAVGLYYSVVSLFQSAKESKSTPITNKNQTKSQTKLIDTKSVDQLTRKDRHQLKSLLKENLE